MNPFFKAVWFAALLLAAVFTSFSPAGWGAGQTRVCKKEVPEITFKNLSPPYTDYSYFQHHAFFPFDYRASSFSIVNAWWLAEVSTLVYADEAYVRERFQEAGLTRVTFFNRSGTQCFVAAGSRFAIVAFRGSEIWKRNERFDPSQMIYDFKTNIDIRLSDWIGGGRVHSGFKAALEAVWTDLLPEIRKHQDRGANIWVTGHSLGASLATLAAGRLQNVQGVYTFGSPRVGDQGFKESFRPQAFRVINGSDIVAGIPPENPYRHVGEPIYIGANGSVDGGAGSAQDESGGCLGASKPSGSETDRPKYDSGVFIPASIRDHVPLLYAIFLWNELVDRLRSEGRE